MRLPEGTAIGVTDAIAKRAEQLLAGDPDIETYTTYVGQGSPRFWLGLNPVLPNPNFAQIVIVTKDLAARERVKARLEGALADGALAEARTRVDRFVFGPPVGFPVQFRVIGPDSMKARAIADEVRQVMAANPKMIDAHLDWSEQVKSIRLEVDQDRARAPGLTPQAVAQAPQTLNSSLTGTQYREGVKNRNVVARRVPSERLELPRLPTLTAPLGLIGATGALLIANEPFGFVALLGLIALAGMIMRNTVILVDQIDHDIAEGHSRYQAILDATVRRARPVVLTALAAILGMIPLARSIFWGPMAITIMGGLLVATVLTLLVVPALYGLWFGVKRV